MPWFPPNMAPAAHDESEQALVSSRSIPSEAQPIYDPRSDLEPSDRIRRKNRRMRYLDTHTDYFGPSLELADPLLYDRLIRRFQSRAEREAEGRTKGFSGVLEADLWRSEAKANAIGRGDSHSVLSYSRGLDGEIIPEESADIPQSKEEGYSRWRWEMEMRFMCGGDLDFDYATVDLNEDLDDKAEEDRAALDDFVSSEEPRWLLEDGQSPQGETGIQDF